MSLSGFFCESLVDGGDDFSEDGLNVTFRVQTLQFGRILDENLFGVFPEGCDASSYGLLIVIGTFFG